MPQFLIARSTENVIYEIEVDDSSKEMWPDEYTVIIRSILPDPLKPLAFKFTSLVGKKFIIELGENPVAKFGSGLDEMHSEFVAAIGRSYIHELKYP